MHAEPLGVKRVSAFCATNAEVNGLAEHLLSRSPGSGDDHFLDHRFARHSHDLGHVDRGSSRDYRSCSGARRKQDYAQ